MMRANRFLLVSIAYLFLVMSVSIEAKTKKEQEIEELTKGYRYLPGYGVIVIMTNSDGEEYYQSSEDCEVPYCIYRDPALIEEEDIFEICGKVDVCEYVLPPDTLLKTLVYIGLSCIFIALIMYWREYGCRIGRKEEPVKGDQAS